MNFIQHNLDTIYGFSKKCYKIMLAFFITDEIVDTRWCIYCGIGRGFHLKVLGPLN